MARTRTERLANEIDLELFRLMERASRLAADSRLAKEQDDWTKLAQHISSARTYSRSLMHQDDVATAE